MKKLFSLFLCLVMLCALTIPAFAGESAPVDPITAHGGTPGQINVLLNGQCVKFPDAAPEIVNGRTMVPVRALMEALGAEVIYREASNDVVCKLPDRSLSFAIGSNEATVEYPPAEGGDEATGETITMDCAPYIKGGRTYVPVRFFAQALGYEVGWDGDYQTVILVDVDALAEEIDKDFTVLNQLMARQPAAPEGNRQGKGSAEATITLFDSLNGNKTRKLTASYDLTASSAGLSGKMDYDFAPLWDLLAGYIPVPLAEGEVYDNYVQQLELVKGLMKGSAQVCANIDGGMSYYSMPALNAIYRQQGVDIADDAWVSLPLASAEELEDALDSVGLGGDSLTVGSLLCAVAQTSDGVNYFSYYDDVREAAGLAAKLVGDKKFTANGSTKTLTLTRDDLLVLADEVELDTVDRDTLSQFTLTVKFRDNGDADVDLQCSIALTGGELSLGDALQISVKGSQKGGKSEMTAECHIKNLFKMTLKCSESVTSTNKAPDLTPPKGAEIVPLDDLLNSEVVPVDAQALAPMGLAG